MRSTFYSLLAGIALVASACSSTGVNSADVYQTQAGTVSLLAQTTDTTIQSVDFALNQQPLGSGTQGASGWSYTLNTTQFPNGLYNLTATGMTSAGTQEQLLNDTLYINNPTSGGSGTAPPQTASGTQASFFIPSAPTATPPWL